MDGNALRSVVPCVAVLAALAACSTLDVRSDSSAAADAGVCHTFSWIESTAGEPTAFGNPLNDRRLHAAISQRLQSRGMAEAASGTGDCQAGYAYGSRARPDGRARSRWSVGVGTGWGGWGRGSMGSAFYDPDPPLASRESRVSVDLFRSGAGPTGREPLWHASVDLDLTQLTGAEAEKRIDAAVAAMFAKFPTAAARQP